MRAFSAERSPKKRPDFSKPDEAVLERVQPLDGHLAGGFARGADAGGPARGRQLLRVVDPDLVRGGQPHGDASARSGAR